MRRERATHNNRDGNCVMLDPERGWYLTHRDNPPGEPVRFQGRWVTLCTQADGDVVDVGLPTRTPDSPERVYRARYWPGVRILFGMKPGWTEKLDRMLWLGGLGILAFTVFMLISEMM